MKLYASLKEDIKRVPLINTRVGEIHGDTVMFPDAYPSLYLNRLPTVINLMFYKSTDYYTFQSKSKSDRGIVVSYTRSSDNDPRNPKFARFLFVVENKSNPANSKDLDIIYASLSNIMQRWSQNNYLESDMFQNMRAKFGDKAAQYIDTLMLSRKLPLKSQFGSKLQQVLRDPSKMELMAKVFDFYASIKRLD